MAGKECRIPLIIEKLEALIRRLAEDHLLKNEVVSEYNKWMTGFRGEESVMTFHLEPLAKSNYRIYHNLRLLQGNHYFQMDILILCSSFGLVIEVKNWARDWHFDKFLNQTTTIDKNGKSERSQNPILQAKLQASKLREWMSIHNIPEVPIQYIFVNSNERSKIIIDKDNKYQWNVCHSEFLIEKINQVANHYKDELLDEKDLRRVNRLLLAKDTPKDLDLLHYFNLSPKEIITGVHCPTTNCNSLPLPYRAGIWRCPKCKTESKTAFIDSLNDYFYLIKPTITNSEARKFLHIHSPKTIHRLLTSMNLPCAGKFKHRVYQPYK